MDNPVNMYKQFIYSHYERERHLLGFLHLKQAWTQVPHLQKRDSNKVSMWVCSSQIWLGEAWLTHLHHLALFRGLVKAPLLFLRVCRCGPKWQLILSIGTLEAAVATACMVLWLADNLLHQAW